MKLLFACCCLASACQPSDSGASASTPANSDPARPVAAPTEASATVTANPMPDPPPEDPPIAAATGDPFVPLPPAPAYTAAELLAAHPVQGEGSACSNDQQCDSPLRCVSDVCTWPAAMTGSFDASTPAVIFYPSGGHPDRMYMLETAIAPLEQQRGLMHRRAMVSNGGMIFVNESEEQRNFWMRNTYLPLDIIFVRASGQVDSIQADCPPRSDTLEPSAGPAQYVIELHAGQAADMGLQPGDRVELLNLPAP